MAQTAFHFQNPVTDNNVYARQTYDLSINKGKNNRVSYSIKNRFDNVTHFTSPASKSGHSKIYVISNNGGIIYVGATTQGMASRLLMGLNAHGNNGYYGYQWRDSSQLILTVFTFEFKNKQFHETIEAEIVFLCRQISNQWPNGQTEIHFHDSSDEQKQIGRSIYSDVINSFKQPQKTTS